MRIAPETSVQPDPQKLPGATFDGEIDSLLAQIGHGLLADDATNYEKLNIARKYGPLLRQLKALVPHGTFQKTLEERYPRVNYSKCNRWMYIAKHEAQVAEALIAHSDEAWGPKKMIDYLRGVLTLDEEQSDDEECYGFTPDNRIEPDDKPYYSEFEEEAQDEIDHPDEADSDESDLSVVHEAFVAKAEAEAMMMGTPPIDFPLLGKVVITVFSQNDLGVIQGSLSQWQPKSTALKGSKQTHTVTASVPPSDIADFFNQLSKSLKMTLPNKLKVSVEL